MLKNKENLTKEIMFKDLNGGENKDMFIHLYTNPTNGNLIFQSTKYFGGTQAIREWKEYDVEKKKFFEFYGRVSKSKFKKFDITEDGVYFEEEFTTQTNKYFTENQ